MCLIIDKKKTNSFNFSKQKIFTFFKYFYIHCDYPHQISTIQRYEAISINYKKPIIAQGHLDFNLFKNKESSIYGGVIHAYVKSSVRKNIYKINELEIPIEVLTKDIIAFGNKDDVCFWKYKIPQTSWNLVKLKLEELKKLCDDY
jgi:hypothetical protein